MPLLVHKKTQQLLGFYFLRNRCCSDILMIENKNGSDKMKRHMKMEGKLLQRNKAWSDLKQTQKEWIAASLKKNYLTALKENQLNKQKEQEIIIRVLDEIEERDIWIPISEVRRYFNSKKRQWKRKYEKQ